MYRHIESPGWRLGWEWAKEEVIWNMMGAQTIEQGTCSKFRGSNVPHCCKRDPKVVDLLPGAPYNQQFSNCCRGGVLSSMVQHPTSALSSFQLTVGSIGNTMKMPKSFTLEAPGPGYTCGPAQRVFPSKFFTADRRSVTQALRTWNITCAYSHFLTRGAPSCCVSLSAFYSDTVVTCPTCACGCQNNTNQTRSCVNEFLPFVPPGITSSANSFTPILQCTSHMCPVRIHWHVSKNYKDYWQVKLTVTNFNYWWNYTDWNLVVQHPNFDNLTEVYNFNHESLNPYGTINDTVMMWGLKYYNDMLLQAGNGNVHSNLLFGKDRATFSFDQGWAFPRHIYFNGDDCLMPPPDTYPRLPNSSPYLNGMVMASFFSLVSFLTITFQW